MFGVLVDVSGSMESAYALDRSHRVDVERTHAMLTTTLNIVKQEVARHDRQESIFVSAFGLCEGTGVCDLLSLLEESQDIKNSLRGRTEYEALIDLSTENRAPQAKEWIPKHLSRSEAGILYKVLTSNRSLIPGLIELIPWETTMTAVRAAEKTGILGMLGRTEDKMVHDHKAYKRAIEIVKKYIDDTLRRIQHLSRPRPVKQVSRMFDNLLPSQTSASKQSSLLHSEIQSLIDPMKPYIFGGTPMCKALTDAEAIFYANQEEEERVLFIVSDGMSADGDPRGIARRLRDSGVTIVTCFLTSDSIHNSRCLFDSERTFPDKGTQVLYEMSSTMHNTRTPISCLVDAGWEVPLSGESKLFVQASSLDTVNEFCKAAVSQMTNTCDAFVDVLGKVDLATYINQHNADFKPHEQEEGTCYANAIAAVFHLAMHRIVGREGGIPTFEEIRDRVIAEYGVKGANTKEVIERRCPEYRLRFKEVDESGARQAINRRRPVIAKFRLYDEEWTKFSKFYNSTPKGILTKSDLTAASNTEPGGHAVVLMKCKPKCLKFMNSWGEKFADGGFFRIKDQSVLRGMTFFDIFWTLDDLKRSEKKAYDRKCAEKADELLHDYPSVKGLPHRCPKCKQHSKVGEFLGHILEAECPKCHHKFKPTYEALLQSLYIRNFD